MSDFTTKPKLIRQSAQKEVRILGIPVENLCPWFGHRGGIKAIAI
jgi:hypothetical protein